MNLLKVRKLIKGTEPTFKFLGVSQGVSPAYKSTFIVSPTSGSCFKAARYQNLNFTHPDDIFYNIQGDGY